METIINLLLLGVLLLCAWSGYKKGIVMGVGGLLAIVVSLYGANLLANAFSHDIIPVLRPFASGFMESKLTADDGVLEHMGWEDTDYSLDDLLAKYPERTEELCQECYISLGIDAGTAQTMAGDAVAYAGENGTDILSSVVQILCETVSYVGCFVLAFLLIIIILTVIGNLPNLSFKIPNLDLVNDIGGTLLGVATGVAFCMVIVWVLKFTGMIIGGRTLADGWLSHLFLEHNLLTKYLGL